jgi:pilus assembly protein CpaC
LATPFDTQVPTNDVDFFLLGQMERNKQYSDYVTSGGAIQGPYGAMVGEFHGTGNNGLDK